MKIGCIGLGIMGSRMAANLLESGYQVVVTNRTKDKADALLKAGAIWAENPTELSKQVDIVMTMVSNPEAVKALALGKNGFLNSMPKGNLWMDCSTVNPSFSMAMAQEAISRGIRFLDAPVAGSKEPAANGTLVFLVGGNKSDVDEVSDLLDVMGSKTLYMGGHGKGSSMKILVNQMLGQTIAAFSEAIALGTAMGMDQKVLFDTMLDLPVTPPFFKGIRPRIENSNYEANFPLKHIHKDLHLFTTTAFENKVPVPLTNATKEQYAQAVKNGMGDLDFSAIFKYVNSDAK